LYAQWPVKSKDLRKLTCNFSKIFIKSLLFSDRNKKKVVGDDTVAPKKPQWGIPHPSVIRALLFMMIMMSGVWQDWIYLLRSAYNCKCAASCDFEVILIIAAYTCLKI